MRNILIYTAVLAVLTQCKSPEKKEKPEANNPIAFDTSNLNATISPCDNFYGYAIGGWQSLNPVPSTEARWMSFNILEEENREKIQVILDETAKINNPKKGTDEQLIRDFYMSANDSAGIEKNGLASVQPILNRIGAVKTTAELNQVIAELIRIGVNTPFGLYVSRDAKNSAQYITYLGQSGLNLPDKEYYLSKDAKFVTLRKQYVAHMQKMFKLARMENQQAAEQILKLETRLAEFHWDRKDLREPEKTYNKKSFKAFAGSLKSLNMASIATGVGMAKVDSLIVRQPDFFTKLDKLIAETPVEHWKQYFRWQIITQYGSWSGSALEKENFEFFSKQLRGIKEMKPRDERVFQLVDKSMGEPLGKLFVKKHFPKSSKDYMIRLIENLREAYRERIMNLSWMGDSTKQKALKKLNSFTYKIGYPDVWKDYSTLEISSGDVVKNLMNASLFQFKLMSDKLGKPIDKNEWFMKPQTVNAYYSSSGNEIVFPAGILQPPFFHPTFDDAINYGGIGAVIGHEFTHGFDDKGSKSDWDGNLNNWWTDEDRARFNKLTKALANQYSNYEPLPGMHINGEMTLGENIADLGGLTLAYAALKKEIGSKKVAPINGFTWQQRFFLGWANVWKGNITEDELRNRLLSDYHSPGEYRVIGPLANLREFRDAFGCEGRFMVKPDSAMINIW